MKLFVQDNGKSGMIVVIAGSETLARQLMKGYCNYDPGEDLDEYSLEEGVSFCNYGAL
jgi:hypothetical protein